VLSLGLGCAVFLALMAGLFIPLEAERPVTAGGPTLKSAAICSGLFTFNTLLMEALGAPVLEGVRQLGLGAGRPGPLRIAVAMVLADLCGYWLHRAMHRVPALWKLHQVHHAPKELNWLEAWRQHPLDFVAHGVAVGLPAALLGASLSEVTSVVLLRKAFTTFLHANLEVRLARFGLVFATPAFHRVHHSHDRREFDTNFAGTFSFVDRLFGTYREPDEVTAPAARRSAPRRCSAPAPAQSPSS
jgi:sterol desaturase/sphingolipid hydroxylase (fatty acid hydroxylase superfamily)